MIEPPERTWPHDIESHRKPEITFLSLISLAYTDMMDVDRALTHFLNSLAAKNASLDVVMVAITNFGPYVLIGLVAIRWWSRSNRISQRHLAIGCGLATALGLLLNQIILLFYQRPRPYESGLTHLLIQRSSDPSFPSDHASLAIAIGAYLLLARDRWGAWFLGIATLVCLSRVYVGTHFLSDVLGGGATGAAAAFVVVRVYSKLDSITRSLVKVA